MNIKETVGMRINAALARSGMLQKDLAKILGVTDNTISYYCGGDRSPRLEQLPAIAKALDTTTDYLLGLSPNQTADKDLGAVCKYTGLSEQAVEALRAAKDCIDNAPDCEANMRNIYSSAIKSPGESSSGVWLTNHERDVGNGIIDFVNAVIHALTKKNGLLFSILSIYFERMREREYGNPNTECNTIKIDHKKGEITIPTFLFKDLMIPELTKELSIALKNHYFKDLGGGSNGND